MDYDEAYGQAMTRVIFGDKLPEGMNVFAAVGNVLPPLSNAQPAHVRMVFAEQETLEAVYGALQAIEDDSVAAAYGEAVKYVMDEKKKLGQYTGPRKDRITFKG